MKTLSPNGVNFIKSFEGCRLTTYDDLQPNLKLTLTTPIKGTLTIGWGHTANVKIGQTITQDEADRLFTQDIQRYINAVNNKNNVPFLDQLNQNQFDVLVSFCYNCGAGNLQKLCKSSTIETLPTRILAYNKSKGIVLNGLVRRREAESKLFITSVTDEQKEEVQKLSIEHRLDQLEQAFLEQATRTKELPVPNWAIEEFPNILDYIATPTGTHDFWRSVIVALRIHTRK